MKTGDAVYFDQDNLKGIGVIVGICMREDGLWYSVRILKSSREYAGHHDASGQEDLPEARYWSVLPDNINNLEAKYLSPNCTWCTEEEYRALIVQIFNT